MVRSLKRIEQRNSFAESLSAVPFIPPGIITEISLNETTGTLDRSFHYLSSEIKKIIEAKMEVIKALSTAFVVNFGLLYPLMIILPLFIKNTPFLPLIIAAIMGYMWFLSLRMAVTNYLDKAAVVNPRWQKLITKNRENNLNRTSL